MKKMMLVPIVFLTLSSPLMAKEEPVDKLFRVVPIDQHLSSGFDAMLPVIDGMAHQFRLNSQAKEELRQIFLSWFTDDIDRSKIAAGIKDQYKKAFTDAELTQITEFYETPAGRKFLEKAPVLMSMGVQLGMEEAQSKQDKLKARLEPFLKKHNIK